MSNNPAPATPNADAETKVDPTLLPRRVLTWVVAALLGGTTVALGIKFILHTEITATVPLSFLEVPLLPLAAIPMTFFFVIWLDILFGARIVND
jgi:hypothetical protein